MSSPPLITLSPDLADEEVQEYDKIKNDTTKAADDSTTNDTLQCEIKYLEIRSNGKDELFLESQSEAGEHRQNGWWRSFAICIADCFDNEGKKEPARIYVNSRPLCRLLHYVLYGSKGDSSDLQILSPYRPLFVHYFRIEKIGSELFADDKETLAHLHQLTAWIRSQFKSEFKAHSDFITSEVKAVQYDHLWTLFSPKTIVVSTVAGTHRAFRVSDSSYNEETGEAPPGFKMILVYVDFDGDKVGEVMTPLLIHKYPSSQKRRLCDLEVQPLEWIKDSALVEKSLQMQGDIFSNCIGQCYAWYDGIALARTGNGFDPVHVEGRIIIDSKAFNREVKRLLCIDKPIIEHDIQDNSAPVKLPKGYTLICNDTVSGFSFTANKLMLFSVNYISSIPKHSQHSFDELILDEQIKTALRTLAVDHAEKCGTISYGESGKGRGLICLLHGPRGAGKTLTAECVADAAGCPLYTVSSGELGLTSTALEYDLTHIMRRALAFKAILLIKDVDLFLQREEYSHFEHYAIIATFLRMLDSYTGILFLTTTHITSLDDAFLSRIHLPIFYEKLSPGLRLDLWFSLYKDGSHEIRVTKKDFQRLAEYDLNGRQINSIMNMVDEASKNVYVDGNILNTVALAHSRFQKQLAWEDQRRRAESASEGTLLPSEDQSQRSEETDSVKLLTMNGQAKGPEKTDLVKQFMVNGQAKGPEKTDRVKKFTMNGQANGPNQSGEGNTEFLKIPFAHRSHLAN
ncbi:P-loop containing nucleoside triphosphate hydrolase protein [Xylaria telfairii]|nr:P-loop containing nucleoside triphosphate hydrolase protein [Xylaria telfairii]